MGVSAGGSAGTSVGASVGGVSVGVSLSLIHIWALLIPTVINPVFKMMLIPSFVMEPGSGHSGILPLCIAVSYTHLDVYKRQVVQGTEKFIHIYFYTEAFCKFFEKPYPGIQVRSTVLAMYHRYIEVGKREKKALTNGTVYGSLTKLSGRAERV